MAPRYKAKTLTLNVSETDLETALDAVTTDEVLTPYACVVSEMNGRTNSAPAILYTLNYDNGGTSGFRCICSKIPYAKTDGEIAAILDIHYNRCLAIGSTYLEDTRIECSTYFLQITIVLKP